MIQLLNSINNSSPSSTEVVEHCCSITSLQMGETMHNIAKDMDTYSYTLPIGVCAGVAPFNFPAMIPLWMFPVGVSYQSSIIDSSAFN